MDNSLQLKSSKLFENSNIIDRIRQTFIDIKFCQNENEIHDFLNESFTFLDRDLSNDILIELSSSILNCFTYYSNKLENEFDVLLAKSRTNANYIIVASSIINYLTNEKSKLLNFKCQSFIDDSIKEIVEQKRNKDLTIFGHEISPSFKIEFILNILLSTELTSCLISSLFPYVLIHYAFLENTKFDLLFQKITDSNLISILPQDELADQQISDFITSQNIESLTLMNENALSLVESSVFYLRNQEKIQIKGVTKDTILQFISVLMIFLEKTPNKNIRFLKYDTMITEGIKNLENNKSPSINASIDFILKNQNKFINYALNSKELYQYFFILAKQLLENKYNANKMLLLNNIFKLTSNDNFEMLVAFFNEFGIESFNFILKHIEEINKNEEIKQTKLNLMLINPSIIVDLFLKNCSETNNVINFIYFINNLCYNQPVIPNSQQISDLILRVINEKIKDENWDDVLLIGSFMKKNDFIDELLCLIESKVPKEIKDILFDFVPNYVNNSQIDKFLNNILSDPNIESNDNDLKLLFEFMVKDKAIYQNYLTYLICKSFHDSLTVHNFLIFFKKEFDMDRVEFVNIINRLFYYNVTKKSFIPKEGFNVTSLPRSQLGKSIIIKIFDSIKSKPGNFEAFICLKNISSSFPFLFNDIFDETIEIVCNELKYLYLIFEKNETEDHLRKMKSSYSALSFLTSIFQSTYFYDQFMKWFFTNILNLNDSQILGFLICLNWYSKNGFINSIYFATMLKLNGLEKLGQLLNRNIENCLFMNCYKDNIYNLVLKIYEKLKEVKCYEFIQFDEFSKKVDNPTNYICEYGFSQINCNFVSSYIKINGVSEDFAQFIDNTNRIRDFWIIKEKRYELAENDINYLTAKLEKYESLNLSELPKYPTIFSVKMTRYIVMKQSYIYLWLLYNRNFPFVNQQKEQFIEIINQLNDIQNQQNEDEDEDENVDAKLLVLSELYLPQYCQQTLFKNLINDLIIKPQNRTLENLIFQISENQISCFSFLEFISQLFSELFIKNIDYDISLLIDELISLIDVLLFLSKHDVFKNNFVDLCGNNILNIILTPKLRCNSMLLSKTAELFKVLEKNLPDRITQLICFLLSFKTPDFHLINQLIKKIDTNKQGNIYHSIFSIFDDEIKKANLSQSFIDIIGIYPSLVQEKNEQLFSLLENMLHKYFELNQNNDKLIQDICALFSILTPKRKAIDNNKQMNNSSIQLKIKEECPLFWNLFEKYRNKIMDLIENQPYLLDKFKLLTEYPELISFKLRSSLFRKKMKSRICDYSRFVMHIDRRNILTSSFNNFFNKSKDQLLRKFNVIFNGEQSVDEGGPTREWFTMLSKEIFNQNYGLFECSKNTKCYQPSSLSNINPNHIEYFKFAGKFMAMSLIQGHSIDAHLTTSFYKQILNCELTLKDIEDFDDELYKNLEWMLNNDVDNLCMYFEIDTKELGEIKTINLKENGSEIQVTNENKTEFVNLRINFALKRQIEQQVKAFCEGFYSLIDYDDIKIFNPKELDLLICGIPEINVKDFIENTRIEYPYDLDSPVVKFFFDAISKWENDKLAKLLLFMTGSSRVPSNGFKEFCEMTGSPLVISSGGDKSRIPQSHTCFNTICLPKYESEEELNEKLMFAIEECSTFEIS